MKYAIGIRDHYRKYRTRNYAKDLDQIHEDIKKVKEHGDEILKIQDWNEDLPGLGQFYCIPCARHFINSEAHNEHQRGKNHKKRVKLLKEIPYTQAEAESAVGYSTEHSREKSIGAIINSN
ncbi:583_t:CDS:2 [Funneliformis caledonium]|uniref:583_t:CDS:1 n=2 Tax=Funneliformis TaxID=1117308 RepID=A0A9N8WH07_9GLOM|nr:583_t:CDS:2 [Funneliformis caledonium]CAG8626444.1 9871_t:CDS:2 [Funneliformis mosseae]